MKKTTKVMVKRFKFSVGDTIYYMIGGKIGSSVIQAIVFRATKNEEIVQYQTAHGDYNESICFGSAALCARSLIK